MDKLIPHYQEHSFTYTSGDVLKACFDQARHMKIDLDRFQLIVYPMGLKIMEITKSEIR